MLGQLLSQQNCRRCGRKCNSVHHDEIVSADVTDALQSLWNRNEEHISDPLSKTVDGVTGDNEINYIHK